MTQVDTVDILETLGMIRNGINILDLGCFIGNWAKTIYEKGYEVSYTGLDCNKFSLAKARNRVPSYTFTHLDVFNLSYNPQGKFKADEIKLPIGDSSMDLIICHSLFTHLGDFSNATNYLQEIKRVLKPGGSLWITFFQSPPNPIDYSTKRTVYSTDQIAELLKDFRYIYADGGNSEDYNDQLMIGAVYES